jgi:hypothetical protein
LFPLFALQGNLLKVEPICYVVGDFGFFFDDGGDPAWAMWYLLNRLIFSRLISMFLTE